MGTKSKYSIRIVLDAPFIVRDENGEVYQSIHFSEMKQLKNLESIDIEMWVEDYKSIEKVNNIKNMIQYHCAKFKNELVEELRNMGFYVGKE